MTRLDRSVTEIAEDLGNDRSTISKGLDFLEERRFIRKTSNGHGHPFSIDVYPALAFRGKAGHGAAVLQEHWSDARVPSAPFWTLRS